MLLYGRQARACRSQASGLSHCVHAPAPCILNCLMMRLSLSLAFVLFHSLYVFFIFFGTGLDIRIENVCTASRASLLGCPGSSTHCHVALGGFVVHKRRGGKREKRCNVAQKHSLVQGFRVRVAFGHVPQPICLTLAPTLKLFVRNMWHCTNWQLLSCLLLCKKCLCYVPLCPQPPPPHQSICAL